MRPVYLSFQCFGPYMERQEIDFEALQQSGLFLICGETGAGKSTILDAICYALYGKSSGGLRGDLSVMRCKLAGKDDETRIEFIFDCSGKRYRFLRSLKIARKNLNDSHDCQVLTDGVFVPLLENPKATFVNQKAQELIGLTYEQFRQVIILPQGQFEKLLVSDSVEKEKILVSLFHADRWQRIAEELYRRVHARSEEIKAEGIAIKGKLQEYGCTSLPLLAVRLEGQRTQADALAQQSRQQEAALAALRKENEAALLVSAEYDALRKREAELRSLKSQAEAYQQTERQLALAARTEAIIPLQTAAKEAARLTAARRTAAETAQDNLTRAQNDLAAVQATREKVGQNREKYDQFRRHITLLENARGTYESLAERQSAWQKAASLKEERRKEQEQAELTLASCEKSLERAFRAQREARAQYERMQEQYILGIGGKLAAELKAGMPCPVCGSTHHPAPAQPAASPVTDEQLDTSSRETKQSDKQYELAHKRHADAQQGADTARRLHQQATQDEIAAQRDLENTLSGRISGVETLKDLEAAIRKYTTSVANYDKADQESAAAITSAQAAYAAAQTAQAAAHAELAAAQSDAQEKQSAFADALAAAGFESEKQFAGACLTPEERNKCQSRLVEYRTRVQDAAAQLAAQQEKLAGQTEPDMAALNAAIRQADQAHKKAVADHATAAQLAARMEKDHAALTRRTEANEAARLQADEDLEFANRLRGTKGSSLQRYVLGVMLTSITVQANRLLAGVYGGRYQLHRTDAIAGAGRKGGLELEVYDAQNNERRSVTTLSGGEKFLVALSLAIGLSTVVQAQGSGIRLEAMFIDEGFGSLDRESVGDALEVLQGIQRTNGVVGVISHVEQLAETIPAKLEAVKGPHGSRLITRL
ncbi:MAG: SMC family ATPase [Clostridia bacterium]|nr:SMC family ATPase [Clostridia bacterium]